MTTKIVEQMYQDASPPEETIEPDNRIEELEKQISELRYLMARYQEALYETKKKCTAPQAGSASGEDLRILENLTLLVPRSVLRLAQVGRASIERPWKKHFYRHPFKASEWRAMRRAQRRIKKESG